MSLMRCIRDSFRAGGELTVNHSQLFLAAAAQGSSTDRSPMLADAEAMARMVSDFWAGMYDLLDEADCQDNDR